MLIQSSLRLPTSNGLRDYGVSGQIGLEETPEAYVQKLVEVFREVKRVLKKEGTFWLNLGDSYAGSGKGRNGNGEAGKTESLNKNNRGSMNGVIKPFHRPSKTGNFGGAIHRTSQNALRASENVSFGNLKQKDLVGIPWRVAFALQADGWYLRQDIIWAKPNPMPESVTDRCTKSHEYIFLLSKSPTYYFDNAAIREPAKTHGSKSGTLVKDAKEPTGKISGYNHSGDDFVTSETRNRRSVWTVATHPFKEAHFATFPEALIEPMVLAGCPKGGIVLDPFFGAGTTGVVAKKLGRNYLGIELNPEYIKIAQKRIDGTQNPLL